MACSCESQWTSILWIMAPPHTQSRQWMTMVWRMSWDFFTRICQWNFVEEEDTVFPVESTEVWCDAKHEYALKPDWTARQAPADVNAEVSMLFTGWRGSYDWWLQWETQQENTIIEVHIHSPGVAHHTLIVWWSIVEFPTSHVRPCIINLGGIATVHPTCRIILLMGQILCGDAPFCPQCAENEATWDCPWSEVPSLLAGICGCQWAPAIVDNSSRVAPQPSNFCPAVPAPWIGSRPQQFKNEAVAICKWYNFRSWSWSGPRRGWMDRPTGVLLLRRISSSIGSKSRLEDSPP